jgi:shikimate dehydrogenase
LIEAETARLFIMDVDVDRRRALVHRLALLAPAAVVSGALIPSDYNLVVNATPLGMMSADPLPVDAAQLDPSAFVVDLVTKPVITPLLEAARRRGCRVVTGEDMFAVQAGYMADILLARPAA